MRIINCRKWIILICGVLVLLAGAAAVLKWSDQGAVSGYTSETQSVPTNGSDSSDVLTLQSSNDPFISQQWALARIQAPELWRTNSDVPGPIIAVLDTGIDSDHEDLADIVIAEDNFTRSPTVDDINGHGTHVAGIIGAARDNARGIAGLASGVCLLNAKVADDQGRFFDSDVARGITWAVDHGANVINLSLARLEYSSVLAEAVDYAWDRGAVVVAAAGNDNSSNPVYPAGYENVISVAALNENDILAPLSNSGKWVDVAAPGMNIYSTLPDNQYGFKTGTSCAAANVSGLAAVLFSLAIDLNGNGWVNDEVRDAIENGCRKLAINGVGQGRIDAAGSLLFLKIDQISNQ